MTRSIVAALGGLGPKIVPGDIRYNGEFTEGWNDCRDAALRIAAAIDAAGVTLAPTTDPNTDARLDNRERADGHRQADSGRGNPEPSWPAPTPDPLRPDDLGQQTVHSTALGRRIAAAKPAPSVRESLERLGLPQTKGRIPPEIVHPAPFEDDYYDGPIRSVTTPDGQVYRAHVPCCWCGEHHEEARK